MAEMNKDSGLRTELERELTAAAQEWGFISSFAGGTRGAWREYRHEAVLEHIFDRAGNPEMRPLEEAAAQARARIEESRTTLESIASLAGADAYLDSLMEKTKAATPLTISDGVKAQTPRGDFISRDMVALSQGIRLAPH